MKNRKTQALFGLSLVISLGVSAAAVAQGVSYPEITIQDSHAHTIDAWNLVGYQISSQNGDRGFDLALSVAKFRPARGVENPENPALITDRSTLHLTTKSYADASAILRDVMTAGNRLRCRLDASNTCAIYSVGTRQPGDN